MTAGQWIITLAISAACLPLILFWGMWLIFALLAFLPPRTKTAGDAPQQSNDPIIDILIPAHDEEALLPRLLETLRLQTAQHHIGTVLVVADHCSDRTAALARDAHANVLERSTGPRGKPAALRDGIAWLTQQTARNQTTSAPARHGILVIDADCTVSPNLIEQTAAALARGAAVTQAAYILDESHGDQRLHAAAQIAFALKNDIRPRGMAQLSLPTQLFGTGNCFRTDILDRIHFQDHLTEDLAISHDLLLAGIEPVFLPAALVRSPLPTAHGAMTTQKLRWETGQVQTWKKLPRILLQLLAAGRLRAVLSLLDWSAPPVAMGVIYLCGVAFASACLVASGWASQWSLLAPAIAMTLLSTYVLLGALQISGIATLWLLIVGIPRFLFWKVALYSQMLAGRGPRAWHRTPRQADVVETK